MTDASLGDEVQRLAHVRDTQEEGDEAQSLHTFRTRAMAAPGYDGDRLWSWQTCTEFAFYQTCEVGSECFFTQGLADLSSQMSFCETEFGLSEAAVGSNVDYSNAYYGAAGPVGARVVYVNGEVDPWHANSVLVNLTAGLPAIYVPGAP